MPRLDQPWFFCQFKQTAAFEEFKPMFDKELELLNTGLVSEEVMAAWEEAVETIDALGLILVSLDDSSKITDFLLHIDGEEAWFRY